MNKFDVEINNILANKIKKAKRKIKKEIDKTKIPTTPSNRPTSGTSPALKTGMNKDTADSPMPLQMGV